MKPRETFAIGREKEPIGSRLAASDAEAFRLGTLHFAMEFPTVPPLAPCMYCKKDTRSRLTRCWHPAHAKCVMRYLVWHVDPMCDICLKPFRAKDVRKVLAKYPAFFTAGKYEILNEWMKEAMQWEPKGADDLDEGNLTE